MSIKTENEIISYRKLHGRGSFFGETLEENATIRRNILKAVDVFHNIKYRSDQDEQVLNILEEILFPKSRQPYFYDEGDIRDPEGIGIDCVLGGKS
tara:strand:+ start:1899 stop:2186 length:288 start_codon:yes stop_codon:yes gene_type:complete